MFLDVSPLVWLLRLLLVDLRSLLWRRSRSPALLSACGLGATAPGLLQRLHALFMLG